MEYLVTRKSFVVQDDLVALISNDNALHLVPKHVAGLFPLIYEVIHDKEPIKLEGVNAPTLGLVIMFAENYLQIQQPEVPIQIRAHGCSYRFKMWSKAFFKYLSNEGLKELFRASVYLGFGMLKTSSFQVAKSRKLVEEPATKNTEKENMAYEADEIIFNVDSSEE